MTCCSAGLPLPVGVGTGNSCLWWGGRCQLGQGKNGKSGAQRAEGNPSSSGEGDVIGMLMSAEYLVMSDTQMAIQNARS